jgi:shikimate 5-dehydrogenase
MYSKIIGHQVEERARSPLIWNHLYNRLEIESEMKKLNLNEDKLQAEITEFIQNPEYRSILLAAPLKGLAVRVLRELGQNIFDDLDSINLIYKTKNVIRATSTDGFGAMASLGISNSSNHFLILGYGGTSKSIINAIQLSNKDSTIKVATRRPIAGKSQVIPIEFIDYEDLPNHLSVTDVIINATTLGNADNLLSSPVGSDIFAKAPKSIKLMDVNYNDTGTTTFLEYGKNHGLNGTDGRPMNLYQALYAFKLTNPNIDESLEDLIELGDWQNV